MLPNIANQHLGSRRPGQEERFLSGAACHGCLFVSETSCENRNDFLDRALVYLGGIPADSAIHAEAQSLRTEVQDVQSLLERAGAAYHKGNCEEAVRLYGQVRQKNAGIRAADEGIRRCKKEMPAGTLE